MLSLAALSCRSARDATPNPTQGPSLNANSNVEEWIRLNKDRLDRMTRQELLDHIPVIYDALSPQVKASIWKDKLDNALHAKTWSAQQQAELRTITDMLSASLFGPDN